MKTKKEMANKLSASGKSNGSKLNDKQPYLVCIGASAGGLNAVSELVSQLPQDVNAAILVVLHLSKAALGDILISRIKRDTRLECSVAKDKETFQQGHIYIAPPDKHLLVNGKQISIGQGPP